jgi:hypothetical protein
MTAGSIIHSVDLHTPEMIDAETRSMLCSSGIVLTTGHVMALALAHSPYIMGGIPSEDDIRQAMAIIGVTDMTLPEAHNAICSEIQTAFRVFEIIIAHPGTALKETLGPEWYADIFAACARAMPALTWEAFLHQIPMVVVAHLAAAAHRAAGGKTKRPEDFDKAFALLDELKKKRQEQA